VNSQLASFETIKNFKLLPKDFTTETGELTPSLKLKRKVILNKYQTYVDELFK
jgi:long-chain acyl-CoA synthetase